MLLHQRCKRFPLVYCLLGKDAIHLRCIYDLTYIYPKLQGLGDADQGDTAPAPLRLTVYCGGHRRAAFSQAIQLVVLLLHKVERDFEKHCDTHQLAMLKTLPLWSWGDMTPQSEVLLRHRGLLLLMPATKSVEFHMDCPLSPGLVDHSKPKKIKLLCNNERTAMYKPGFFCSVEGIRFIIETMPAWVCTSPLVYTDIYSRGCTSSSSSTATMPNRIIDPAVEIVTQERIEDYETNSVLSDNGVNQHLPQAVQAYLAHLSNSDD